MNKRLQTLLLSSALLSFSYQGKANIDWFEDSSALTQAHTHLLNDDLSGMFTSLVEVWQKMEHQPLGQHLNALFAQSLEKDCGASFDHNPLPDWIDSIHIQRITTRSPGNDSAKALIQVNTDEKVASITLSRWVDKQLSADSYLRKHDSDSVTGYVKRYNLTEPLAYGLYRLQIQAKSQVDWNTWVIIEKPNIRQRVLWVSQDEWAIEKRALLNPYCSLPTLTVELLDYVDGDYRQVWGKEYVSDYPRVIEEKNIPDNRYVLLLSLKQSRWQGKIVIDTIQQISKTYDLLNEEE
ncbi:hypothetical protein BCU68_13265 [Vibrio sp. 10N.286.49.B3]|uniref:DUF2861 family protein n=1 Tax=Vibrio sp. 10N.286.49.B3 TaxID=1880855 RepID=UPI000C853E0C|nr:DUF2861 family protein [Vibrio sp. 10N.286.49.B3]PMH43812.1 hypothetical protein BCU68_13265 [Vibrio sp. 10N.286.49.B3]